MRQSCVVVHTIKLPNLPVTGKCHGNQTFRRSYTFRRVQLGSSFPNREQGVSSGSTGSCSEPEKKIYLHSGVQTAQSNGGIGSQSRRVKEKKKDDFISGHCINPMVTSFRTRIVEENRGSLGQELLSLWQNLDGGSYGGGFWSKFQPKERLSQFFHISLLLSLSMTPPWMGSASAMTSKELIKDVHESTSLHPYESSSAASPLHKYNIGDTTATFGWLSQEDSLSQKSFSLHVNEGQPRLFHSKEMFQIAEASKVCEETYGFLPCSDSVGGNLALIVAYGYLLLIAAQLISKGSELLLEVMNPGLIGGLLLPILGSLPDALLIFASGSGGTLQEAQEEVMVGVGVLAGSIVMLLTVGWSGSLFAGRCDLSGPEGTAKDRTLTKSLDWTGTGVTTDEQTRVGAWIMMLSTIPFICVQVPLLDGHPTEGPEAALIGCIVAVAGVLAYCTYQVSFPWLQQKRIEEARLQYMRSRALQGVTSFSSKFSLALRAPLLQKGRDSGPSQELLKQLFASFDSNQDGHIQKDELKGLLIGLELEEGFVPDKGQTDLWMTEFDVNMDGTLSEPEFLTGITKWAQRISEENWLRKAQQIENSALGANDPDFWAAQSTEARKILELLEKEAAGEESDEEEKELTKSEANSVKKTAGLYLLGGAALAALFADPLVDSIGGFSSSSGIPPFFVAFIVTPFASNASELFSSILFAKQRRKKNISLTFSQLYGAVTMNNTLCLGLFLGVVYLRGLNWDFSSEVTVILLSIVTVGAIGGTRTTFPLWLSVPVLAVYPLCIALVAILDNCLGWH